MCVCISAASFITFQDDYTNRPTYFQSIRKPKTSRRHSKFELIDFVDLMDNDKIKHVTLLFWFLMLLLFILPYLSKYFIQQLVDFILLVARWDRSVIGWIYADAADRVDESTVRYGFLRYITLREGGAVFTRPSDRVQVHWQWPRQLTPQASRLF